MSTQRWEAHRQRTASQSRAEAPEHSGSAPVTRFGFAAALGQTARLEVPAMLATNSLLKDHLLVQRVRQDVRSARPPLWTGRHEIAAPPMGRRSSLSLLSVLSGSACFHRSLPQAPSALSCRAERSDGKRDLHFLYAA